MRLQQPVPQPIHLFNNISFLCLNDTTVIMDSEKQSNYVLDGETRKDDIASSSLEDGANGAISGGGEKELQSSVAEEEPKLEIWNKPRINMWRYFATLYTFIIMGMNDAAYGVSFIAFLQLNFRAPRDIILTFVQALIPYVSPSLVSWAPYILLNKCTA